MLCRERKERHLVNSVAQAGKESADTFDKAVAERGGVTLTVVNRRHLINDLGDSEGDISNSAPQFACGTVVRSGRSLNIRKRCGGQREHEKEDGSFHEFAFKPK